MSLTIFIRSLLPKVARPVILVYHRIADPVTDPWGISVSPKHFDQQMTVLRREASPIRLSELGRQRRWPGRRVVVTADDGYSDNLRAGNPILQKHDVPATLFVTSGTLDRGEFWWDELDRLLLRPHAMPALLTVKADGQKHEWRFSRNEDSSWHTFRRWRAWEPPHSARQKAFQTLYSMIQPLSEPAREEIMAQIRGQIGSVDHPAESDRPLRAAQLAELIAGNLVEVGAHTVTHPVLSQRSAEAQLREIAGSKQHLESITNRPVTSFAYPFGRPGDYTSETIEFVERAGFHRACSNFAGRVDARNRPYELPRMGVGDWDGEEFAQRLKAAFRQ